MTWSTLTNLKKSLDNILGVIVCGIFFLEIQENDFFLLFGQIFNFLQYLLDYVNHGIVHNPARALIGWAMAPSCSLIVRVQLTLSSHSVPHLWEILCTLC